MTRRGNLPHGESGAVERSVKPGGSIKGSRAAPRGTGRSGDDGMSTLIGNAVLSLGLVALFGASGWSAMSDEMVNVDAVRDATRRYADVEVALREGFVPVGGCVSAANLGLAPEMGAVGVHYVRPDRLGLAARGGRVEGSATRTDFMAPSVLIYEPQAEGAPVLVAAGNIVFEAAWTAAGHQQPPSFLGQDWDHRADDAATPGDEAMGFTAHWERHVWLRPNPLGPLVSANPAVACPAAAT